MTPEVLFHAGAGALGIISGVIAVFSSKGGRVHRAAGTIFFVAMIVTAVSAVFLGIRIDEIGNALAGTVTVYFLLTAWMAVKRPEGQSGLFEAGAFLIAAAGSVAIGYSTYLSVQQGEALLGGIPGYTFAAVAGLCALLDLTVILRQGISGTQRIARHLWRMHLGFFVAVGSFFPGQLQFFPEYIQEIRPIILLFIPPFTVAGLMLFWLAYAFVTRRFASQSRPQMKTGPAMREPRSI